MWNIIRFVKNGDYAAAVVPDHPNADKHGYVAAHRVIMENYIGRLLEPREEVHHKDENKYNNDIENLEILMKGEHQRIHSTKYPDGHFVELVCECCGKVFQRKYHQRPEVKKYSHVFCSKSCSDNFQKRSPKDFEHGTVTGYGYHACRCDLCKEHHNKRMIEYNRSKRLTKMR